jgi:hypothetical protein
MKISEHGIDSLTLFHTGILHSEIQLIRLGYLVEKISEHGIDSLSPIPHWHFLMAQWLK